MSEPLLSVRHLSVEFPIRSALDWPWTAPRILRAVSDVSFDLAEGETLGIVGESGCGKSTLARAISRLIDTRRGEAIFENRNLLALTQEEMRPLRKKIQIIFQDPQASLNPRMTVGEILAEPLRQFVPELPRAEREKRCRTVLERVGILANNVNRYPHEFSGGQCQRIGIARALTLKPKLLICDEPVSALDVSVQAQVINLLKELQAEMGLSMIFVAHDIGVVHHISNHILVMYLGRIVEYQTGERLLSSPLHPYTQALLSAVPVPDPEAELIPEILEGDLPSPLRLPKGCAFASRCAFRQPRCESERPELSGKAEKLMACHFAPSQRKRRSLAA